MTSQKPGLPRHRTAVKPGIADRQLRHLYILCAFFLLLPVGTAAADARWYISNAAGMALEPAFSRLALRGKYALTVEEILPGDLPANLREFYDRIYLEAAATSAAITEAETEEKTTTPPPFFLKLEKRIIYENRQATRLQWLFLDRENLIRLAAAFALDPAEYPPPPEPADSEEPFAGEDTNAAETEEDGPAASMPPDLAVPEQITAGMDAAVTDEGDVGEKVKVDYSGYVELYNPEGYIVEEHQFSSDSADRTVNYFYNKQTLLRAVTRMVHPASETEKSFTEDYYTDYYRYSRSSSLRGVERVYHTEAQNEPIWMRFPHVVLGAAKNTQFVNPGITFSSEFFDDIIADTGPRVFYVTDDRGRILTETRRNEEGEVIGELQNAWSGDRLTSVRWKAGDDERVTEFGYDGDGDRILERNINRGVLERVVRLAGGREIEEIYMDGKPVLRAVWENGRKISEERIRPQAAAGTPAPAAAEGSP